MAAANQNLQNVLQNQTTQQNDRLSFNQTIDGIPRADWNMKDKMELDTSLAEKRYANLDAYSVAQGIVVLDHASPIWPDGWKPSYAPPTWRAGSALKVKRVFVTYVLSV